MDFEKRPARTDGRGIWGLNEPLLGALGSHLGSLGPSSWPSWGLILAILGLLLAILRLVLDKRCFYKHVYVHIYQMQQIAKIAYID